MNFHGDVSTLRTRYHSLSIANPLIVNEIDDSASAVISMAPSERSDDGNHFTEMHNRRHSFRQGNYNWFARFFRIKPASEVIVLAIPKARARREVVKILREWKQYGMVGVHIDKKNSIVYGRVGHANCKLRVPTFHEETQLIV